jgi:hypothetical protein
VFLLTSSTNFPAIANAPLPAEGSASFSNYQLAAAVILVPWFAQRFIPFRTGWKTYFFLLALFLVPVCIAYWTIISKIGGRINEKVPFPGKPLDHYLDLKGGALTKYQGRKIPMQVFHDAYFDGKVDFKGDVLDVMEYRHDWASFEFTPEVSQHEDISDASSSATSSSTSFPMSSSTLNPRTRTRSGSTMTAETTSTLGSSDRG